jgi:2-dehydro-3-deoxygluconokinase
MRLCAIGEAMGELRPVAGAQFALSIAGDVFNTLAYLRGLGGPAWYLALVSGVGTDPVSEKLHTRCAELGIRLLAGTAADTPLGLYMIGTDSRGERSFTYWRSASPARQLVNMLQEEARSMLLGSELVLLSGISLAILDDAQRERLVALLQACRDAGARIVFDPNYRARLWKSPAEARHWVERLYRLADVVLPGLEDELALFGRQSPEEVLGQPALAGAREVVIKAGRAGVVARVDGRFVAAPFVPAQRTVDTTAAGDSFNAAWLVARRAGLDPERAARFAASTAAAVVAHAGAIVPFDALPPLFAHQEVPR